MTSTTTNRKSRATNGTGAAPQGALTASLAVLSRKPVAVRSNGSDAFRALDSVESALIDVQATAETFRQFADESDVDAACDTLLRHLERDLGTLRAAFDVAFRDILAGQRAARKGGAA